MAAVIFSAIRSLVCRYAPKCANPTSKVYACGVGEYRDTYEGRSYLIRIRQLSVKESEELDQKTALLIKHNQQLDVTLSPIKK